MSNLSDLLRAVAAQIENNKTAEKEQCDCPNQCCSDGNDTNADKGNKMFTLADLLKGGEPEDESGIFIEFTGDGDIVHHFKDNEELAALFHGRNKECCQEGSKPKNDHSDHCERGDHHCPEKQADVVAKKVHDHIVNHPDESFEQRVTAIERILLGKPCDGETKHKKSPQSLGNMSSEELFDLFDGIMRQHSIFRRYY